MSQSIIVIGYKYCFLSLFYFQEPLKIKIQIITSYFIVCSLVNNFYNSVL